MFFADSKFALFFLLHQQMHRFSGVLWYDYESKTKFTSNPFCLLNLSHEHQNSKSMADIWLYSLSFHFFFLLYLQILSLI